MNSAFRCLGFVCLLGLGMGFLGWYRSSIRYSSDRSSFFRQAEVDLSENSHSYRNNLKNREFDKEDVLNLMPKRSRRRPQPNLDKLGDAGGSQIQRPPTQSKTDASGCFGIAKVQDKVLICANARNVAKTSANTIQSIQNLGKHFSDYRVIIYENNSTDGTELIYADWAKKDPHVFFLSETLSRRKLALLTTMKVKNRTEQIARSRNRVLDVAMHPSFDGYQYVIWADLDFEKPWAIDAIVDTITSPKEEWDAVLAYGAYDLFALRSATWPIGSELVGDLYWERLAPIREQFVLDPDGPWEKVYSAFGGIGIYKRKSILGCRYSGIVTKELEEVVSEWLSLAREKGNVYLLDEYEKLLAHTKPISFSGNFLRNRSQYPPLIGLKMHQGKIVWFSCSSNTTLPWTCEHVSFHAAMKLKGHDRIFINPKISVVQ